MCFRRFLRHLHASRPGLANVAAVNSFQGLREVSPKGHGILRKVLYRAAVELARPILQQGFPGRWSMIARGINAPGLAQFWEGSPLRWVRSVVHGFDMPCDMTTFSGRSAFFMRRWYEAETQSLILSLLKPGDHFVDVGANVGMATLTAAKAVGEGGSITAFEPNVRVAEVLGAAIDRNGLRNVEIRATALTDAVGQADFYVPASNHGEGSLATAYGDREGKLIQVNTEDSAVLAARPRCNLVKIDVEGYEAIVLKSLDSLIRRDRPMILCELEPIHLSRAGSSVQAVGSILNDLDYRGFRCFEKSAGPFHLRAAIEPLDLDALSSGCNSLWVPSSDAQRLASTTFRRIHR